MQSGHSSVHADRPPTTTGALLYQLRQAHAWSMRELSGRLGNRSSSHVVILEGDRQALTPAYRARLGQVYGLPADAFTVDAPPVRTALPLQGHPLLVAAVRALAQRLGVLGEEPPAAKWGLVDGGLVDPTVDPATRVPDFSKG